MSKEDGFDNFLIHLLKGDASDNLKGAKGIGDKRAVKLLEDKNRFGKIRAVYEAYNDKKRLKNNIRLMQLFPYIYVNNNGEWSHRISKAL